MSEFGSRIWTRCQIELETSCFYLTGLCFWDSCNQVFSFSSRARLIMFTLRLCWLSALFPPADSQQTEHLSSYQLTVPRPIGGRLRRDVDGRPPNQVLRFFTVSVCVTSDLQETQSQQLTSQEHFLSVWPHCHSQSAVTLGLCASGCVRSSKCPQ